jgi:hypothetical protein
MAATPRWSATSRDPRDSNDQFGFSSQSLELVSPETEARLRFGLFRRRPFARKVTPLMPENKLANVLITLQRPALMFFQSLLILLHFFFFLFPKLLNPLAIFLQIQLPLIVLFLIVDGP